MAGNAWRRGYWKALWSTMKWLKKYIYKWRLLFLQVTLKPLRRYRNNWFSYSNKLFPSTAFKKLPTTFEILKTHKSDSKLVCTLSKIGQIVLHSIEDLGKMFKTDGWAANRAAESKEASLQFKASGRSKKTGDLSDFDCGDQAAGLRIL